MIDRVLSTLARGVTRRPRAVIRLVLLASLPLGLYGGGLRVSTARTALVSEHEPHWRRYLEFAAEFGIPEDLVVVAEGPDPVARAHFVDRTAALLAEQGPAAGVPFAQVPLPTLARGALYARSVEELRSSAEILSSTAARQLLHAESLGAAVEATAQLLESPEGWAVVPEVWTTSAAVFLTEALTYLDHTARGSAPLRPPWSPHLWPPTLDATGHLLAGPTRTLLLVRPPYARDEMAEVAAFVSATRRAAEQAQAELGSAVKFGLTGLPATIIEELETIQHDSALTTILSLLGVVTLFLAYFPSLRILGFALVPVLLGVVWTAAGIRALYGQLNLMSSIFLVVIVGMGIDFSVHLAARMANERRAGRSPAEAATTAVEHTGRGLLTGAFTSAGAFLTLLAAGFQGIEELGGAAALGLTVTLFLALIMVPAFGALSEAFAVQPRTHFGAEVCLALARRSPVGVLLVAAALSGLSLWGALHTRFDFSLIALLPEDSPSGRLMDQLLAEPSFSAQALVLLADDPAEARRLTAAARRLPGVRHVESAAELLPEDVGEKAPWVKALAEAWGGEVSPPVPLEPALLHLEGALEHAAELAFAGRRGRAASALEASRARVEALRTLLQGSEGEAAEARLRALEAAARPEIRALRADVQVVLTGPPPRAEDLPPPLRQRFVSSEGRQAIYVVPAASIWDREAMEPVITALRRLGPVTGFPETFYENAGLIRDGFLRAAAWSLLVVFLLAAVDLRRPRDVLLSLLPVLLGALWMLGALHALGLSYNLANVVGVPVIAGVAIDGGVHVLHRYREEGDLHVAVVQSGAAVMLSSLTTMVGFGSLAFASHRGYQSLGLILFVGVGASLLVAMTVLPACLGLLERR